MTINNVWLSPERALVAVDTAADLQGIGGEVSKMLVLPHANVVFAGRGSMDFMRWAFEFFQLKPYDMDSIERDLTLGLAAARRFMVERMTATRITVPLGLEFVVVGWSLSRNAIVGVRCEIDPDGIAETAAIDGWRFAPWHSALGEAPPDVEMSSIDGMKNIARRQVDHFGKLHAGFGGRLIVAELTKGGMSIRDAGSLG